MMGIDFFENRKKEMNRNGPGPAVQNCPVCDWGKNTYPGYE
jgi:hypothetical protein